MQKLTLLHSDAFPIGRYADVLSRESIAAKRLDDLEQLRLADSSLRVVLIDRGLMNGRKETLPLDSRTAVVGVGLEEHPAWLADDIDLPAPAARIPHRRC